jgi:ATP-binding cassette subfamily B protein
MINEVRFENVSFGYEPNILVLKNISFNLKRNMKLAIVGPTGAGKSTLINLLTRFYDPCEGVILIDGYDIRDIKLASLRSHIGIVLQDSFLFPISIRENIRFAKLEASDQEIIAAAKSVGAHDFIMKLPNDYDYQIQEGSSNISIGQRQLISFARTLVANPEILVLDEATSSVDAYTELVIQNALKTLMRNRMTIIIAHRLSTVRLCDEILIIDHGSIVEKGTHEELMQKNGLYSSFYRLQFREETGADVS